MRVLLYSRAFAPLVGGMERFAEELAIWLAEGGHEVWLATATPAGGLADSSRPYRVLRRPSSATLAAAARWADVVHVNGLALRAIAPARLARRRPVVTHAGHQAICPTGLAWDPSGQCSAGPKPGPCGFCPRKGLQGATAVRLHRIGTRAASRNVCVSRYLHERVGLPSSITIYNPLSRRLRAVPPRADEQRGLVAFAGRLVAEKGLDLLLRALVSLPDVRLQVAGNGPMRSAWERMAREFRLEASVRFLGELSFDGVAELYARAAVVCVPSVWDEPFGYAAAEAMAVGKAVVATPRGALPELLGEGRGFVAPACTPDALAEALKAALGDAPGRAQAAARARAFALREFDIDRIGQQYLAVYEAAAA